MRSIQDATGYDAVQYNALLSQAETYGVSAAKVENAMLALIDEGKDFFCGA